MKTIIYISLILLISCNNKNDKEKEIREILSGEYSKLWIEKSSDETYNSSYYELLYKDGRCKYVRRDRDGGYFVEYFNHLSGDAINNNKEWYYRNDTLSMLGFEYKILKISKNKDTIFLESYNKLPEDSYFKEEKVYLIDSKLMN